MKSYRKHILISLFLIIGLFIFTTDKVEATKLTTKYYTLQCIYSDGGLYTRSYNAAGVLSLDDDGNSVISHYSNNRISYNLRGSSNSSNSQTSLIEFVNAPNYKMTVNGGTHDIWTCKPYVLSAVYEYSEDDADETDGGTTFYKFVTSTEETFENKDFGAGKTGWQKFWGITSDSEKAADAARESMVTSYLVSESYVLDSSAPEPNVTLYYVNEATQASGSNKYIEIMIYDNVVLVRSDDTVTQLEDGLSTFADVTRNDDLSISGDIPETITLNDPERKTDTSAGTTMSYYYNDIRYALSSSGTTYTLTDDVVELDGTSGTELCDEIMPETSKVLKRIIQYAQFLIPVFLIVLIGIDLGKIVISGNLDEELPKQKKKIITRLVIAIIFFFLPLITSVLINMMVDSDNGASDASTIKQISCLFE